MTRYDFTSGWSVQREGRAPVQVTLPHDAMIHERRDRAGRNGGNTGYYPGGRYTYRKAFRAPDEWRGQRVSLFVEGPTTAARSG